MNRQYTLIAAALAAALAGSVSAAELRLAPAGAMDTIPTTLSSEVVKNAATLENAPVEFAWRLDGAPLEAIASPYQASSKEYWDRRSADELVKGVTLDTVAPGALVRLSPLGEAQTKALEAREVILRKDGRTYANGTGMVLLADADELEKGAAPFTQGTTVFRIDPALGAGRFELVVPKASGEAIVHVYEPESSTSLELALDQVSYQKGQPMVVRARLADEESRVRVTQMGGLITAPDGQVHEISFKAEGNMGFIATLPANFAAAGQMGLYEVETFATGTGAKGRVLRDARTAFAYTVPSARFTGEARTVAVKMRDPNVVLEFDVEVAAASRYQIGAVLYGTSASGEMIPVAAAQSAAVLKPGVHALPLTFAPDVLDGAKAGAPWEIRDLRLINQADMGLQEQRVQALSWDGVR
jgi:hypothetical protein